MKIQAAAIQMPCDVLDLPANLQRADELLRLARDAGAELAVLPELFNTGYSLCPDYRTLRRDRRGTHPLLPPAAQPAAGR